jgi:Raf kinase inhibitor-like YbhB/YbcL family protein
MKKILILLCIPALVFAFSACGNSDQVSTDTAVETSTSDREPEPESSNEVPSASQRAAVEDALLQAEEALNDMQNGETDAANNEYGAVEVPSNLPGSVPESPGESESETVAQTPMSLSSAGVAGGILGDAYGMRGNQQDNGVPTLSPPLSVQNAPNGTVGYAVVMLDPDSKPLCGYEWTHWLAAGITTEEISENASINSADDMVQGQNDFGALGYGGPTPPDKPHTYKITVYALDAKPDMENGFSKDELLSAINGHILAQATLDAKYSN